MSSFVERNLWAEVMGKINTRREGESFEAGRWGLGGESSCEEDGDGGGVHGKLGTMRPKVNKVNPFH